MGILPYSKKKAKNYQHSYNHQYSFFSSNLDLILNLHSRKYFETKLNIGLLLLTHLLLVRIVSHTRTNYFYIYNSKSNLSCLFVLVCISYAKSSILSILSSVRSPLSRFNSYQSNNKPLSSYVIVKGLNNQWTILDLSHRQTLDKLNPLKIDWSIIPIKTSMVANHTTNHLVTKTYKHLLSVFVYDVTTQRFYYTKPRYHWIRAKLGKNTLNFLCELLPFARQSSTVLSYVLPFVITETPVRANLYRLFTTALNRFSILKQSLVQPEQRMLHYEFTHNI